PGGGGAMGGVDQGAHHRRQSLDARFDLFDRHLPEAQAKVVRGQMPMVISLEAVFPGNIKYAGVETGLEHRAVARGIEVWRESHPRIKPAMRVRPVDISMLRHMPLKR